MELKISPPKSIATKKVCYNVSNGGEKCSIELGLNLELSYSNFSTNGYGFTFPQRQELEQQFFIYKYIEAGLPVPTHLIIPIYKSFTCSLKGLHDVMGYGHMCWEHKSRMEPEPRRCKRTDGKKWRCSKGVVQNQKYCEKHMHRGRQRSRKCVELTSSRDICCSDSSKILSQLCQIHQKCTTGKVSDMPPLIFLKSSNNIDHN
ncbi:growth-regulating factor 10-like [Solanum pennellii]|uniref:Growth-regulating factor n=1 Tax=Solanum pennellii TaxID=28526 RepID=A0ABM1HDG5_SOLPN|nr:growth-regulating factor 10-like [Solanum pennellii]